MSSVIGDRRALAASLVALLAACSDDDPCGGALTCLRVDIESATVDVIDQLELDVVYEAFHDTTTIGPTGPASLPLATAVILDVANAPTIHVGVVAAGKLGGALLGTGAASTIVDAGHHARVRIVLAPVELCVAGALYCGDHMLAGDPETLYRCNSGGVPTARGARCAYGCIFQTGKDDACRGGPLCQDGGRYCGGDKVDGDPKTLYVCMTRVGTMPTECPSGCVVRPGSDDICR
jgi:hypothetical protein